MRTDVSSYAEGGRELAESRIEAERQCGENHIVRAIAEVVADALGSDNEVTVAEHDSLGSARAAGCIEDGGHVRVDDLASDCETARGTGWPGTYRVSLRPVRRGQQHSRPTSTTCSTDLHSASSSRSRANRSGDVTKTRTSQSRMM